MKYIAAGISMKRKFMRCFFILIAAVLPFRSIGQQRQQSVQRAADYIFPVEQEPQFKGGQVAWIRFLAKNMQVPDVCSAEELSGAMVVQFMVHRSGKLGAVEVLKASLCIKEELIRLIKLSDGQWNAGRYKGRFVESYRKVSIMIHPGNQ
jgi:hypothetical protein